MVGTVSSLLLPLSGWHGGFLCCLGMGCGLASAHYSLCHLGWRICTVRKVSPVWAEEGKSAVGGGNPSSRSSLCRPGEWLGDSCFFGLAPHLGTGFCVLVSEGDCLAVFTLPLQDCKLHEGEKKLLSLSWCKAQNIHKK